MSTDNSVTLGDGRVIRDLTDEEYDATYSDPGVTDHALPAGVLEDAIANIGEDD